MAKVRATTEQIEAVVIATGEMLDELRDLVGREKALTRILAHEMLGETGVRSVMEVVVIEALRTAAIESPSGRYTSIPASSSDRYTRAYLDGLYVTRERLASTATRGEGFEPNRGIHMEERDGESEEEFEIRQAVAETIMARWNQLHDEIEQEGFRRDEDDDRFADYIASLEEDEPGAGEAALQKRAFDRKVRHAEMAELEQRLAVHGARPMRPYEHWNEDEAYMEYAERDRGDEDYNNNARTRRGAKKLTPNGVKLDKKTRARANEALDRAGFGGRVTFRSVSQGLSTLFDVLAEFGIVTDSMLDAQLFKGDSGRRQLGIGKPVDEEFMPPVPIDNSVVAFAWYKRESGNYEIVAYLS